MEVRVSHLSASYGKGAQVQVLHDVSFTAASGRRLCVMGANGSGKTTLLRALIGAIDYEGDVSYGGVDLKKLSRRETGQRVALLTQMNRSYFSYSVEDTVAQGRYAHRAGFLHALDEEDRAVIEQVLRTTGLSKIRERSIATLSGGQLQRVFLARTLAQETPVILLDEPTNHLDLKYQEELLSYLAEWSKGTTLLPDKTEHPNTVIGVFHDINLALSFAEDVCVLKEGRLLAFGACKDVLTDALLQEAFDVDVRGVMQRHMERWQSL